MSVQNRAAYLVSTGANPLEVADAPYTRPRADEIVIRTRATAINPIDWIKQNLGDLLFSWCKYPLVMGIDCAGEVVEVGSGVTRFRVGDRVVGHAAGMEKNRNSSAEGAFQLYTVLVAYMVSPIPEGMSFEMASVMPLGLSTAACGLYMEDQLKLQRPSLNPTPTGKTLIVWGGSTSVGCNAIQLGVASGYEVFSTSSPRNFKLLKSLGASQVFDYNSKTVVADMIAALKGKTLAGAISMGKGSAVMCMDILSKCKGNRFVAMATAPGPFPPPKRFVIPQMAYAFISFSVSAFFKCRLQGLNYKFILGGDLIANDIGPEIYEKYLPQALAQGKFVPAPDPQVIGQGLEHIQRAFNMQQEGISAKKLVVTL